MFSETCLKADRRRGSAGRRGRPRGAGGPGVDDPPPSLHLKSDRAHGVIGIVRFRSWPRLMREARAQGIPTRKTAADLPTRPRRDSSRLPWSAAHVRGRGTASSAILQASGGEEHVACRDVPAHNALPG